MLLPCSQYSGQNDLDTPDAQVLASHTSQLTLFPSVYSFSSRNFGGGTDGAFEAVSSTVSFAAASGAAATALPLASPVPAGALAKGSGAESASAAAPAPAADSSSGGGAAAPAARIETVLVPTILVTNVVVGPDGVGSVSLPAPQKLGSYVVRAYAASSGARFGSDESSFIVARQLSLTSSIPRLVRVGDRFEAGIIVTLRGLSGDILPVVF